jgi:hypothetical protein
MGNTLRLRYPTPQPPVHGQIVKYLIVVFRESYTMTTLRVPFLSLEHGQLRKKQTCILCCKERVMSERDYIACVICKLAYYCDQNCMDNDRGRHVQNCNPNHMVWQPLDWRLMIMLIDWQHSNNAFTLQRSITPCKPSPNQIVMQPLHRHLTIRGLMQSSQQSTNNGYTVRNGTQYGLANECEMQDNGSDLCRD